MENLTRINSSPYPHNLISMILNPDRKVAIEDTTVYSDDQIAGLNYLLENAITDRLRRMILLWTRDGLSLLDIGELFGVTRQNIFARISSALRELRTPENLIFLREGYKAGMRNYETVHADEIALAKAIAEDPKESPLQTLIDYGLTMRSYNVLSHAGVKTVREVMRMGPFTLSKINGCGPAGLKNIRSTLQEFREVNGLI